MRKHQQTSWIDLTVKYLIPKNDPLKILFESIDFSFIYQLIKDKYKPYGAHGYNPVSLLKALILIYLGYANSERDLAKKLKFDARLSYLTGFSFGNTPAHNTFHYFRKRLGYETFLQIITNLIAQAAVIIKAKKLSLSIDSTHIESFESDEDAKWGVKEADFFFYGYKVHIIVTNTDPPIPLSVEITPGNKNDGKMLPPLIRKAERIVSKKREIDELCGDAIYDTTENISLLMEKEIVPYIPENRRNRRNPLVRGDIFITEEGEIICKGGEKLIYWGYEKRRKRYKFRCPLIRKEGSCIFYEICWRTKYGPVFYLHEKSKVMDRMRVIRNSAKFKEIYKKRSNVERFFSVIKERHRLVDIRVKGIREVSIHVVLSIMAYIMRVIAGERTQTGLLPI